MKRGKEIRRIISPDGLGLCYRNDSPEISGVIYFGGFGVRCILRGSFLKMAQSALLHRTHMHYKKPRASLNSRGGVWCPEALCVFLGAPSGILKAPLSQHRPKFQPPGRGLERGSESKTIRGGLFTIQPIPAFDQPFCRWVNRGADG